jgi:hypothetical protein
VHLSRGGVGWSVGGRGFRTGVSARGRRTTTVSAPGTGLGYRTTAPKGSRGCLLALLVPAALLAGAVFVAGRIAP